LFRRRLAGKADTPPPLVAKEGGDGRTQR